MGLSYLVHIPRGLIFSHVLPLCKVLILIRPYRALIDCSEVFEPGGCLLFAFRVVRRGPVLSRESQEHAVTSEDV